MKSLLQHINEKLKISNNTKINNHEYEYFYHEALEDGYTTKFIYTKNVLLCSINECKKWYELKPDTETPKINKGQRIYFKGENMIVREISIGTFKSNKKFNVGGNIMSLIYGDNFKGQTKLLENNQFAHLFYANEYLVSCEDLLLPATELTKSCYCGMFLNCTSLTKAPALPATELVYHCYGGMFNGCKSLKEAPELRATKLVKLCYSSMFMNCTSLNKITMLATDNILADHCLEDFFYNISKTGTFTKAKGVKIIVFGGHGIPKDWTVKEI